MTEPQILTLPDWSATKPEPFKLTEEGIKEIEDLVEPLRIKLMELGAPATIQYMVELKEDGASGSRGVTIAAGAGAYTVEYLAYSMIAEGGLQVLLDNLEMLLYYAGKRNDMMNPHRIIVP